MSAGVAFASSCKVHLFFFFFGGGRELKAIVLDLSGSPITITISRRHGELLPS